MSKRFGRNQKRALKERIRIVEAYYEVERACAKIEKKRADRYEQMIREWDHEIQELLGRSSSFSSETLMQDVDFFTQREALQPNFDLTVSDPGIPIENMYNFIVKIEAYNDLGEVRKLLRIYERDNRTGQACLTISESQYKRCGFTERDIRHLVRLLYEEMGLKLGGIVKGI